MRRQDHSVSSFGMRVLSALFRLLLTLPVAAGLSLFSGLMLTPIEYAVVLIGYLFLLSVLHKIYHACSVGHVRVSELILSQTLSNMICVAVLYLSMSLYEHALFNPLPLLLAFIVQEVCSVIWSVWVNKIYFNHYTPPRTAIIYTSDDLLQQLYETPYFDTKYNVCKLVKNPGEDIQALIRAISGCEVVFATGIAATLTNGIAKYCAETNVKGFFVPRLGHIVMAGAEYTSMFSVPLLKVQRAGGKSGYRAFKRVFDVMVSLIGISITLPIMLAVALAIKLEDHGPVFYLQTRLTRNGKEFSILKFRSMKVNAEKDGIARLARKNDNRITRTGRFIRACRLDELPQLFNILMGDMSIVGPRPERPEIACQYEQELPEFSMRLQVKAGLTGMAQVYGRYNTEPYNKLQMDLMYINQMSLTTDLKLIMATVKILFVKDSTAGIAANQLTASDSSAIPNRRPPLSP